MANKPTRNYPPSYVMREMQIQTIAILPKDVE